MLLQSFTRSDYEVGNFPEVGRTLYCFDWKSGDEEKRRFLKKGQKRLDNLQNLALMIAQNGS